VATEPASGIPCPSPRAPFRMSESARVRGRDIVCVGFADWKTELWTNQHHLMSRLAEDNRVLFVESLGLRRPQLARRDLVRLGRRLWRGVRPPRRVVDGNDEATGLWVLSPLVLPLHGNRVVRAANARIIAAVVPRIARRLRMHDPILWAYVPQAEPLVSPLRPSYVVYHCVDDIAAQKGVDASSFAAAEDAFVRRADLVLASSPPLAARFHGKGVRVANARNVADTHLFATALESGPIDAALTPLPRPRLVFAGAVVATKLDVALVTSVARARRDWSIVLVGPIGAGDPGTDVAALTREPNIHLLGMRTQAELPAVFRGVDVALIPYARNELTKSVFPMKLYEYLAAGLPVVATRLEALDGVTDVTFADTEGEMVAAVERLLSSDTPAQRAERSQGVAQHSWDRRLAEIAALIEDR
jgi:glycosyltransferase involved in cell wall biosynthesis